MALERVLATTAGGSLKQLTDADTARLGRVGALSGTGPSTVVLETASGSSATLGVSALTLSSGIGIAGSGSPALTGFSTGVFATKVTTAEVENSGNLTLDANGAGDTTILLQNAGAGGLSVSLDGNVTITGNLTVQGALSSTASDDTRFSDNHLYLNDGYGTVSAQTGGLAVNYLPTATNDTVAATGFVAGVAATSNPTVKTAGSATFAASDFIQIAGASNESNNGLFEVLSHVGTTLTIRGVGTTATVEDFTQNQFATDTTVAGTIRKVNVSVIRAGTDGNWETGKGAVTGVVFTDLAAGATALQASYEAGSTIQLSDAEGDLIIETDDTGTRANVVLRNEAGTANYLATNSTSTRLDLGGASVGVNFVGTGAVTATGNPTFNFGTSQATFNGNVDATAGLDVSGATLTAAAGATFSAGEVLVSGGNFQLNDSIVATFGTGDDLSLTHNGTNSVVTSTTGDLIIDNTNVTGATIVRLGTNTSATKFAVQGDDGSDRFSVTGATTSAVFNVNVDINDTFNLRFGTGGTDDQIGASGANTLWTHALGDLTFDNTSVTGMTLFDLGTDTTATAFKVRDNSLSRLFEVMGNGEAVIRDSLDIGATGLPFGNGALAAGITGGGGAYLFYDPANPTLDFSNATGSKTIQLSHDDMNFRLATFQAEDLIIAAFGGTSSPDSSVRLTRSPTLTGTTGEQVIAETIASFAPTSGTAKFVSHRVTGTVNQTGAATGDYTMLEVDVTETAATGTNKRLADFKRGGTTQVYIDRAGNVVPGASGNDLGTTGARWDLFGGTCDFSGATTFGALSTWTAGGPKVNDSVPVTWGADGDVTVLWDNASGELRYAYATAVTLIQHTLGSGTTWRLEDSSLNALVTVEPDGNTRFFATGGSTGTPDWRADGYAKFFGTLEAASGILLSGGNFAVTGGGLLTFGDSATLGTDDTLVFGAGSDFFIGHDGTRNRLRNIGGVDMRFEAAAAGTDFEFLYGEAGGADEVRGIDSGAATVWSLDSDGNVLFAGTLAVTGDTTLTGDLAVNGGDLTTTSATFNLINANATTVNFAGAGTTIGIGASTGTLTISNATTKTKDLNPITADTYSLGSPELPWFALNLSGTVNTVVLSTGGATTLVARDVVMLDTAGDKLGKAANAAAASFTAYMGVATAAVSPASTIPLGVHGDVSVALGTGQIITRGEAVRVQSTGGGGTAGKVESDVTGASLVSGDYKAIIGIAIETQATPGGNFLMRMIERAPVVVA